MRRIWIFVATLVLAAGTLNGQDYRATLVGTVSDASGAVMPQAQITVTDIATGIVSRSETNGDGAYVVPFLAPGTYTLQVKRSGFQTYNQTAILLQANDRKRINVQLAPGVASTSVTVTSETPLLDTAGANNGQTISQKQLVTVPVHSLNPMEVLNLSTGVQYEGGLKYYRAYDNGSIEAYSINGGGESQNNYQLDGFPNATLTFYSVRPQVAFVPPIEGVQETRVQTNTYDAQYGGTLGGIVSLVTKSGTNDFHGAAYYAQHRTYLDANNVENVGGPTPFDHVDQFGFELGGPVRIPKVYNGRNHTFFTFAFEHYSDSKPQPAEGSVPTLAQRGGDFSQTYNNSGNLITIYDPDTTKPNPDFNSSQPISASNPQYLRDPFPDNKIPKNRMDPVALKILNDIPEPNSTGDATTHLNNWLAADVTAYDTFNNFLARVDHQINDQWKIFGRWDHNYRNGSKYNRYNWQTPARQYTQGLRQNDGVGLDAVGVLNPQSILTFRLGYHRFLYSSNPFVQDLSYLGIPITSQLQEPGLYPLVNFTNYIGTGINQNDISPFESYTGEVSMIKNLGRHSLNYGFQYMIQHFADVGRQNGQGVYSFTPGFTQEHPQLPGPASGQAIASFLLGDLASASVNLNAAPYISWHNAGLYIQDNWQVTPKLMLNLGMRWDFQSAPEVRHDAQNRGFDFNATSPVQIPGMTLKGGLLFAGVGQPSGAFDQEYTNIQPRFGFAYRPSSTGRIVIRGGIGRSFAPLNYIYGGNTGFAQTTVAQTSTPEFKPLNKLSNAFPNGLTQPQGSSLGLATNLGNGISFTDPQWKNPYTWQYSLGVQYEISRNLLLDVAYVGSKAGDLGVYKEYDYLSPEQLQLGAAYLNEAVPNPFYGVLPANSSIGAQPTITRANLLVPYPQFTNVTDKTHSVGSSSFNSLQVKGVQRMKYGLEFMAFYTWSKDLDTNVYINPQDKNLATYLDSYDARNRFIVNGTYDLPLGAGRRWLTSGLASQLIGGWTFSTTGVISSGLPMANPSGYFIKGDPNLKSGQTMNHWFNTSPDIWEPIPPYTLSNVPPNNSTVRSPTAPQFDASIFKFFHIRESSQLEVRMSAFNATNTPFYYPPDNDPSSPTFGQVIVYQQNLPRSVELGARYSF